MHFERVTFSKFADDVRKYCGDSISSEKLFDYWTEIPIPKRKTEFSCGYDVATPIPISVHAHDSVIVPTGIKAVFSEDAKELRRERIDTPILMLTARTETGDRVKGLDSGADYYLTKPFEMSELLACVRALTRRQGEVVMDELSFGELKLNLSTCDLSYGDKKVRLGKKEFSLMRIFMSNGGAVISKETLINKVWGFESDAEDNNVEVYISFL